MGESSFLRVRDVSFIKTECFEESAFLMAFWGNAASMQGMSLARLVLSALVDAAVGLCIIVQNSIKNFRNPILLGKDSFLRGREVSFIKIQCL